MTPVIIKRNGRRQPFDSDKLYSRVIAITSVNDRMDVDVHRIVANVERGLPDSIGAETLDHLLAEKTAELAFVHPSYDLVAGKIEMDILRRTTPSTFSAACHVLGSDPTPILTREFMADLSQLSQYLDLIVESSCCHPYTYSAMKTMERSYLLKKDGRVIERPTYMYMRVALHLHRNDITLITKTYEHLLHHAYTHATPTMANAGTIGGQLSSCYVVSLGHPYTTTGLYRTLSQSAEISTSSGGIGIDFNTCPSIGSAVGDQISLGLPPVLQLFDASLAVNVNGQSRRPPAITGYIEPWHADIFTVINMRRNRANNGAHLRNLYQALWIPDLFMSRVHNGEAWSLFSPQHVPLLSGCFGPAFEAKYVAYEMDRAIPRTTVPARSIMNAIAQAQIETGGPFMMYKDSVNFKNNQENLGTISHSNLCTEIMQYSSPTESAVCNLASIVLPTFVRKGKFDYMELHRVVETVTYNLNRVIDRTVCPTASSRRGNQNQRAIGIGIQGLADAFIALDMPYQSEQAKELNREIMITIYHAALTASVDYARVHGCYPSYAGSPLSKGQFQFNLWNKKVGRYNWDLLREDILRYGVGNSLLVALMPTSGTSQITGCTESFEPIQSNIFTRHVLAGEYRVLSPALVQKLSDLDLWSENTRLKIIRAHGSIQGIEDIPAEVKAVFKTGWEIGPQPVIDLAVDRGPFVCQSQSLSVYMENPTITDIVSMHFYTWRSGLKTGMYYLRTRAATAPIQITVPLPSHERSEAGSSSISSTSSSPSLSSPSASLQQMALLSRDDSNVAIMSSAAGGTEDGELDCAEGSAMDAACGVELRYPEEITKSAEFLALGRSSDLSSDDLRMQRDSAFLEGSCLGLVNGEAPFCDACSA